MRKADAAVLRQAALGNVELGHDFQARDQRGVQRPVGLHHLAQRAVDAKAHGGMALVGLDVDVAGAIAGGLRQQRVEHADDGRVVRGFQQVFDGGQVLHHARQVGVALDLADHRRRARFALGIGGADALDQRIGRQRLQLAVRVFAQHLADSAGHRVGMHQQREVARVFFQQELVAAGKGVRQGVTHRRLVQRGASGAMPGLMNIGAAPGAGGSCARAAGSTGAWLTGTMSRASGWASRWTPRIRS